MKVGVAKHIIGDISTSDSIRLATAIGLAKYAHDKYEKKIAQDKDVVRRLSTKVVDLFNNYF